MEALGISLSNSIAVRPAIALPSDLAAVLREGQVLAGEVLQTLDGGTLLLGIGGHRVPAESHVELPQGQRFLFQVFESGGTLELRVLGEASASEPALASALRSLAGRETPMARLLAALASGLHSAAAGVAATAPSVRNLLDSLAARAFRPGSGGEDLERLLESSGLRYEARLADIALAGASAREGAALGRELAQLLHRLVAPPADPSAPPRAPSHELPAEPLASALREELARRLGTEGKAPESALARWSSTANAAGGRATPGDPLQLVRAALSRVLGAAHREFALRAFDRSGLSALGHEARLLLLRALLGLPERAPASPASRASALQRLEDDLKLQLLRATEQLASTPATGAREAIARALASLEAEQLLNVAREWSHQALHASLPVPDGDGWASAHLFFDRHAADAREGPGGQEAQHEGDDVHRLVLAVDFTRTGPIRAELVVRTDSLALRVLASREDVVAHLALALDELEQRLSTAGRRVSLSVGLAAPAELDVENASYDIAFLREHPLMNVSA